MRSYSVYLIGYLLMGVSYAQTIHYQVSFPNAIHHEARIDLTIDSLPHKTVTFQMSRSSPGRYATHEFGKNVYDVRAFDQQNKPLPINQIDGDVYEVSTPSDAIRVQYTLYGNYPDGTYSGIDPQSIHLNMPATFMWAKGFDQRPIDVRFALPAENTGMIATQLIPTPDRFTFRAPNRQYFMDSPVKIGELLVHTWQRFDSNNKPILFRLALEAVVADSTAVQFAHKVTRLADQAKAVFGEFPNYDYGTYTFIGSINPFVRGDGMEHRNSALVSRPWSFTRSDRALGGFAHEFFHSWNVERIRPQSLEPFNFEKSNMSDALWFAEGFTEYYGNLLLVRSGFSSIEEYATTLTESLRNKLQTPGATLYSPIDASRQAVFVDAGVSIDQTNYPNRFTSYYDYGAAIALALDLTLRQRQHSLDEYMQRVWQRFGKPEQPYSIQGLQTELAILTDSAFANSFFRNNVYGHAPIDYVSLLAKAGFTVKKAHKNKAWLGAVDYSRTTTGLQVSSNTIRGTPIYEAGVDIDDQLVLVDGQFVNTVDDLQALVSKHVPGEALQLMYRHRGEPRTCSILLVDDPTVIVATYEKAGLPLTSFIRQFRTEWLGPKKNE